MTQAATLVDPLKPLSQEFLVNPYPTFRRLREEAPVFWSDSGKYWMVSGYDDVRSVLREQSYGKQLQKWNQAHPSIKRLPPVQKMLKARSLWMLNQDPPDHTRLRGLVNKAFTPKMIETMKPRIQEIANELIDKVEKTDSFDLVQEYAFQLSVTVIAEMLGVPAADRDKFKAWSTTMTETFEPGFNLKRMRNVNAVNDELIEYLKPLVASRRKEPQSDLISALVAVEEEGSRLTEDELLGNCILILVAGHETSVNLIASAAATLLLHPDQLTELKDNADLIGGAISEVLRYESPVQIVRRLAREDMELGGQKIKEGEMVVMLMGSANRDPEMFDDPDKFDIHRENSKKHLAYGHGIHYCLGSSLADAEGEIAISTLFRRLPGLKLRSEQIEIRTPFALRGPKTLPVLTR